MKNICNYVIIKTHLAIIPINAKWLECHLRQRHISEKRNSYTAHHSYPIFVDSLRMSFSLGKDCVRKSSWTRSVPRQLPLIKYSNWCANWPLSIPYIWFFCMQWSSQLFRCWCITSSHNGRQCVSKYAQVPSLIGLCKTRWRDIHSKTIVDDGRSTSIFKGQFTKPQSKTLNLTFL